MRGLDIAVHLGESLLLAYHRESSFGLGMTGKRGGRLQGMSQVARGSRHRGLDGQTANIQVEVWYERLPDAVRS
jgi:hypothetical protein